MIYGVCMVASRLIFLFFSVAAGSKMPSEWEPSDRTKQLHNQEIDRETRAFHGHPVACGNITMGSLTSSSQFYV